MITFLFLTHLDNHTDQFLLSLLKEGNELAFSELYRRYAPRLIAMAYAKLNSKDAAKEIVQETFMDLWTRRSTLQIDLLPNYLSVAVKYKVLSYIRNQSTAERHYFYYKAFIKISDEQTANDVNFHALKNAIEEGIKKLPDKTQTVFRMSRLEHLSIAEIASVLKLSEKAIKYHITRSLKELRLHLKEYILLLSIFLKVIDQY